MGGALLINWDSRHKFVLLGEKGQCHPSKALERWEDTSSEETETSSLLRKQRKRYVGSGLGLWRRSKDVGGTVGQR